MASIWKGAIAFGLVNIAVELRAAVRSVEKLHFRQLDKKHHKPIRLERVSTVDGKSLEWDDIVKGYEISKGKFVIVDDEDFAAAAVEMSRVLEITAFVPGDSIDPRFFDTPYFLLPQKGGETAYVLLRDALTESAKVAIGTFALRQKQHLAAVKPLGNALVLELMRFEEELVDPEELNFPTAAQAKVRPQEKAMAVQLIANLAEDFDASRYKDVYQDKLKAIIKAKAKGKTIETPDPVKRETTTIIDLVARLQDSLAESKGGRRASAGKGGKPVRKKRATKSSRRQKSA